MTSLLPAADNQSHENAPPAKKAKIIECADKQPKEHSFAADENAKMDVTNGNEKKSGKENGGAADEQTGGEALDKNLYSRQIYTLGESAMMHLREASVLISGLSGLGVELAKNLILGGMRHVSIHDTAVAGWHDLSAQYYLTEEDLGKNRAAACFERLAELNDSVQTSLNTEQLTKEYVSGFDLVILADSPRATQLKLAEWTRAAGRRLLVTDARGLFSYVFLDCGDEFRVDDANGETCKEFHIEHIDQETGDVMTIENSHHGLEDGDHVTFSEIKGMVQLNECTPIKITVKKPHIFNIGDAAKELSAYLEGGRGRQVKVPFPVSHKPLAASLTEPEYCIWDYAKFDYPAKLHALWSALYAFEEKHGRSPASHSESDAQLLKAELQLPEGEEVSDDLLKMFANSARGNLVTVASVVGGIAAQEAMKAVTHHMTPLKQWLYLDAIEAVPGQWTALDNAKLTEEECAPRNSRYDGQAAVFGWTFQEQLLKQRWFIVGSGAIGCELLKNMAMMGLGCGKGGLIKITDMDQIEISNLNRQFLFRRADVGSKKAEVAARAVRAFNSQVNIECMAERVGADTEGIFNDDFFASLHGVANALDNVDARRYMDRRCVYYRLPLLESGTMGTKGNTQVVYPHMTESYGSSADPPEKEVPFCTLRNFPNEINHTIQWARNLFEGVFSEPVETANRFLKDQRHFLEQVQQMNSGQQMDVLSSVKKLLIDERPKTAEDCIRWARLLFQENHYDSIAQMLHAFPPDQVTDMGVKFWSGLKRCPHVLNFDPAQEMHFDLIYAGSILRAEVFGIKPITDRDTVAKIAAAIEVKSFKPREGVKIAVTDAEAKEQASSSGGLDGDDELLEEYKRRLALISSSTPILTPIDFEKDDDSNHHMEFITAASNLRAENYDIARADKMKTKQIAGRIIPAIATTTAAVAGLVCIELYKTVVTDEEQWKSQPPMDRFKNGFINLALPFYGFSEPIQAAKKKYGDIEFTLWDRIEIRGPKTLAELKEFVEKECGVEVGMISAGPALIYSFFMDAKKRVTREATEVSAVVQEVTRTPKPEHVKSFVLEVMASNPENDEDVEIPYIKYDIVV
ncbi:hypothetical protein PFISCL1PPCAC_16692 [Pristionchus fissidentatus]|uniref:E1 ubiquitin-activating enzyme n=1 Tax=Pristionchus fissidentatus TaxID=1538716 RepID=A0AAV5W4X1_9BILA|nr:hypothetical protein PFISCL1PPCAC_16692 [Pristionchus fissidentatus]